MKTKKYFTEEEKVILSNLPNNFKYIARDETGVISIYEKKPTKNGHFWIQPAGSEFYSLPFYSHLFQCVKWTNLVPYEFRQLFEVEK